MRLGPAFTRKILIGMALAALVYLGMSLWSGLDRLLLVLRAFPWPWLVAVFGLSLVNYGVRFLRWQAYLRALSVEIPWGKSLRIFLSGFVLTITPGKAGEVVKSFLLKMEAGTPVSRSAPIVVAERITDFLALLFLSLFGLSLFSGSTRVVWGVGIGIGGIVLLLRHPFLIERLLTPLAGHPRWGKGIVRLFTALRSMREMLEPRIFLLGLLCGIVAWFAECLGLYLVLRALPSAPEGMSLGSATFIYAFATIAGALSFLPGGLGVTEGSMAAMLVKAYGITTSQAVAATFLIRVATLWFALLLGAVAIVGIDARATEEIDRAESLAG